MTTTRGNAAVIRTADGAVVAAGVAMMEAERVAAERGEGHAAVNLSPVGLRKAMRRLEGGAR